MAQHWKAASRVAAGMKKFQAILEQANARDASALGTVVIGAEVFEEVLSDVPLEMEFESPDQSLVLVASQQDQWSPGTSIPGLNYWPEIRG